MKYIYVFVIISFFISCSEEVNIESNQSANIMTEKVELLSSGDTIVTFTNGVQVAKRNGEYILNGDIMLTSENLKQLRSPLTRGGYFLNNLWYDQIVFYSISPDFRNKVALYQAIEHISNRTNIKFYERSSQKDYILFCNSSENSSYVGRKGGEQAIKLSSQFLGTIVHEICHALGMIHEHARTDRDQYVTIHYDNIYEKKRHNFNIEYGTYSNNEFDFSSIMIYPSMVDDINFAINTSKPVITKKDGSTFGAQREGLSTGDIQALNRMYMIHKYQITGEQCLPLQSTATYTLTNNPIAVNIDWEITPSTGAVITSGQGTNKVNVTFSKSGTYTMYATITFRENYSYYSRKSQSISVDVSHFPMISDIEAFKYLQESGEYTLKAMVVNRQDATTQWSCDGNAVIYEIPYPGDASFMDNPQLFKAIDFYSTGTYNISVMASNTIGNSAWFTKSFNINDVKRSYFPLLLSPNPMPAGVDPIMEIQNSENTSRLVPTPDKEIKIIVYSEGKEIYNKTTYERKIKLALSKLKKGKYNVVVSDDKKSYTTALEVI